MTFKPSKNIQYFLYARKSSDSEDRQVQSIDDQIKCLKNLADRLGLQIVEVVTESKSAKRPYIRPVFSEMVKRIEKGEANGIICWQMNRLFRNPVDQGTIHWMLQESVIKSIQTIDHEYTPEDNVLLLNIEGGMANQFIIDLRKNCRRGMIGKAERGWMPSIPPNGYINNTVEKTIETDPQRFALVRRMWDMLLSGNYTPPKILEIANNEWGFRTRKYKRQGDRELARCTIYKMFTNIFYTGMFEWNGKLYKGNHTPMISLEEFDRAQVLLGREGRPRPKTHEFAYTGLISCGECGGMVTASEKQKLIKSTGTLKTFVYYHCTKRKKAVRCFNQKPVTLRDLEAQIADIIGRFTIPEELLSLGLKHLENAAKGEVDKNSKVRQMQEQSLHNTERELTNLTQMRYKDLIDDKTFIAERDLLQNNIARLKRQLEESKSEKQGELTQKAFRFAAYARHHFQNGDLKQKREIFAALGSNYMLKDKKLLIDAVEWLQVIEKRCPPLISEFKRLELIKSPYMERWNKEFEALRLTWCATVDEVRTVFEKTDNPELNIPDFSQITLPNKTDRSPP